MSTILLLDVTALLDTSKVGAAAAKQLEQSWDEAKRQPEDAQRTLLTELTARRNGLRTQLLERARPIAAELARQKGAVAVLERGAVFWSQGEDITAAVIAKVDAAGPLT
jgi:Skp family chaperone for outer membrane proteins